MMMIGIGKSALVQAFTSVIEERSVKNNYNPIEVFIPETDTCIVDTCGYGALLRVNITLSFYLVFQTNKCILGRSYLFTCKELYRATI